MKKPKSVDLGSGPQPARRATTALRSSPSRRPFAMQTLFEEAPRAEILRRIDGLTPRSARLWGRMTVGQMVAHCSDQLRLSLGDLGSGPAEGPMRFPPIRRLIIHWLPWPKGKAQAPPELFTTAPVTLDGDREALRALIERFAR